MKWTGSVVYGESLEENMEDTDAAVDRDWFLQELVKMANTGVHIGLTLQIGGILVSGVLARGDEYFDAFAEEWASGFTDKGLVEPIRKIIVEFGNTYRTDIPDDTVTPEPKFIHLKNAKFFLTTGEPIPTRGVWWRGRISEVAAFTLGSFTVTPS